MPVAVLRAIGHFVFPSRLLPVTPTMGQNSSTLTDAEQRQQDRGHDVLYRALSDKTHCGITKRTWLLPELLDQHVTEETVQACTTLGNAMCGQYSAEKIVKDAKKAFAILVLSNCRSIIEDLLLHEGLADRHLPLQEIGEDGLLASTKTGKKFPAFRSVAKFNVDLFLQRQWCVLAPMLDNCPDVQIIDPECPLPLRLKSDLTTTNTSRVSVHAPKAEKAFLKVAVKEFFGRDMDDTFNMEVQNLVRIRQFNNPHLIRHITACKCDSDSPLRCLIFPFASGGDLQEYWTKQDNQPRTADLVRWALTQLHGVATGIRDLHSGFGKGTNIRHGDLKPQNILLFEETDDAKGPTLVIADVGIAKVHMGPTAVRTQKGTGTSATTRAYEAPEANEKAGQKDFPRSRAYDIWSLGCIMLEFTIWLLFHADAVGRFASRRPQKWTGEPGGFYAIEDDGTPVVCEEVCKALADLMRDGRCGEGTALGQLVRLIAEKMIVAEVKGRCSAAELVEGLKCILDQATKKEDDGYFLKSGETPASVPEVFRVLRRGSRSGSVTG